MNYRFYNARILTMEHGMDLIDGELWVEGDRITYVGREYSGPEYPGPEYPGPGGMAAARGPGSGEGSEPFTAPGPSPSWDREIDVKGNLLMPGFKNAHTHSAMTFLRSYADDLPLDQWLQEQVFPMEAKLRPEDIGWLVKLAVLEYLTSGITACFDMYFHQEMVAKAAVECGFRMVMVSGLNDFTSSLEELEEHYRMFNQYHPLIGFRLGFHAEYTTSEELLKGVAVLADKYHAPVYTHNSETEREVLQCVERHGMTPTAYLDSLGVFRYGGGGFHCVFMTEEDLEICRKRGLAVVANPGSNTKLASGIPCLADMKDKGILLALGTDGPASNNCLDMFREMFLATGLAKLKKQDAAAMPAEDVLFMAASGGAKAMGLTDCDCLAVGKQADLIMIDLHQPNMQPIHHIVKNLVYSGSKQNVKLTMVAGKILYEDGAFFVGESPETIYKEVERIVQRIKTDDR